MDSWPGLALAPRNIDTDIVVAQLEAAVERDQLDMLDIRQRIDSHQQQGDRY